MGRYIANFKSGMFLHFTLFFLISSILSFAVQPATNYVSRIEESGRSICFKYDEGRKIWCENFSIFIKTSLSQVNPPALVKFSYTRTHQF